ncbi:signal peptide peptidase-like 2B isoform X2 [Littorina saxatilis]|uniref:PA domain-containing protein n=2 Tax=Littorina saxatilis TaxID=31220 RepID=A0AAN9G6N6_9CAEN
MASRLLQLIFILLAIKVAEAEVGLVKVDVSGGSDKENTFCINYNSLYNTLPTTYDGLVALPVVDYSYTYGCYDNFTDSVQGKVVAVSRGNCTFAEKAALIQSLGGTVALVVDYSNATQMAVPGGNSTSYQEVNITVAVMLHSDFKTLMDLVPDVKVWLYSPQRPEFDPTIIAIFALASLCVVTGALWSATSHQKTKQKRGVRGETEEEDESISLGMGIAMSVALLVFFSLTLTLLYFFYDYLVYVVMAIFSLGGTNAVYQVCLPLWNRIVQCETRVPVSRFPCMPQPPMVRSLVLLLLSTGFVAVWLVFRNESFAWILQDMIGICFCLYVMKSLLMPSLKACTVLLGLLFFYDIFFVFITPYFTENGQSVMVKVATGGSGQSKEQMPIVLRLPYFLPYSMSKCYADKYSLLGFGDVILPGLLVTYNCAFDIKTHHTAQGRCKYLYFIATSLAYVVGLGLTGVALFVMKSGQPALLYLVPCTLITTFTIALWRQEFCYIWRGHQPTVTSPESRRPLPSENKLPEEE